MDQDSKDERFDLTMFDNIAIVALARMSSENLRLNDSSDQIKIENEESSSVQTILVPSPTKRSKKWACEHHRQKHQACPFRCKRNKVEF